MADEQAQSSALSDSARQALKTMGAALAGTMAGFAVAGAVSELVTYLGTNVKERDPTGDKAYRPLDEESNADKSEANGLSTEAAGSRDEVKGVGGEVVGSQSEAQADINSALALDTDATALGTAAGATEIATKALKMN